MTSRKASRRAWDWGPRLDEARVVAPEAPRTQRAKKDRKRWCRGKVGVEHQPELAVRKSAQYWKDRKDYDISCSWRENRHWEIGADGVRYWKGTGFFAWSCCHEYRCANCGKILGMVGRKCPEFRPHPLDWKR